MASQPGAPPRAESIEAISAFLSRHIRNAEIGLSDDIFATGLVNSLFALQLVTFIESHFSLSIEDEDLVPENFNSILAMASFVERKQPSRG
jgi:methoxymalonate biosynthesis acyl carrier protein